MYNRKSNTHLNNQKPCKPQFRQNKKNNYEIGGLHVRRLAILNILALDSL